jgi:hypothetical protein
MNSNSFYQSVPVFFTAVFLVEAVFMVDTVFLTAVFLAIVVFLAVVFFTVFSAVPSVFARAALALTFYSPLFSAPLFGHSGLLQWCTTFPPR